MEEKNNNNLIYVLVLIIGILIGVAGVFIAEKYVGKKEGNAPIKIKEKQDEKEEKIEENKEEKKEDNKEDKEKEEEAPQETKDDKGSHNCSICDEEGDICCAIGPNGDYRDALTVINDQDSITSESFDITNNNHSYNLVYKKSKGIEKVIMDNKPIFSESYKVEKIFVLNDGLIGIQYYDSNDQAVLRKRNYYNTSLKLIGTVEGIKSTVDIFSREYEYTIMGNECINDSYHELKIYKATIGNSNVTSSLVRTVKEDGCAGLT